MWSLEAAFWASAFVVLYPYVVYPLLMAVLAGLWPRPVKRGRGGPRTVSFVVCANNEQVGVERRLVELTGILDATDIGGEIILVSDGSTDETAAVARGCGERYVRVLELPLPVGKAEALSRGVAAARNEVVVFADVRQVWAPEALELLLEIFADPEVGAVSGNLEVVGGPGTAAGVGLYWRFEKWLRRQESVTGSLVGVTGAISAVRRELFRPVPSWVVLDDVYWPLLVVMQGHRVVHDGRALAYDRLPARTRDEFWRKVRTLAGNFQLVTRLPSSLLPWGNPAWFRFLSHKVSRLLVPWALLGLLACSIALPGAVYFAALVLQSAVYGLGVVGALSRRGGRSASAAAAFVVLNAAAWTAFWVWVAGRAGRSWRKVEYESNEARRPEAPAARAGETERAAASAAS
jgi:cellulose synthase/poly-beta-1,6-N-acetylglucosamine synthase-like glycosyltransferase